MHKHNKFDKLKQRLMFCLKNLYHYYKRKFSYVSFFRKPTLEQGF